MITPSAVLFNGGVFKADELRGARRSRSSPTGPGRPVPTLESADLDLAVARGAAYYGQVRRGKGVRIRGGVAAVLLRRHRDRRAGRPGRPAADQGPLRRADGDGRRDRDRRPRPRVRPGRRRAGRVPLPRLDHPPRRPRRHRSSTAGRPRSSRSSHPLETALAAEDGDPGETVPVRLHSHVTEVGTLDLWCHSTRDDRRWKLEFNVREPSELIAEVEILFMIRRGR